VVRPLRMRVAAMTTHQALYRARVALDATPSDSPNFPNVHRAFVVAFEADCRYHACDIYQPEENFGSICATCGETPEYHRAAVR
jgi:hypothetical protein